MLPDDELAKLCHGLIVHAADLPKSSGKGKAGPHFCLILNSDEEIKKSGILRVAGISSDRYDIDPVFRVQVPARTGVGGFICCSWLAEIHERHVTEIGVTLTGAEMLAVQTMIRKYQESKSG